MQCLIAALQFKGKCMMSAQLATGKTGGAAVEQVLEACVPMQYVGVVVLRHAPATVWCMHIKNHRYNMMTLQM